MKYRVCEICGKTNVGTDKDFIQTGKIEVTQSVLKEESKFIWTDTMKNCQLSNEETE